MADVGRTTDRPQAKLSMERLRQWHQMTPEEQSCERWIHNNKDTLSRSWGSSADRGKHKAYHWDNSPYSPTKVMGVLLRVQGHRWKPKHWRLARAIAGNRSLRYPVMAAQLLLRRNALRSRRIGFSAKIERYLDNTETWSARLEELRVTKGVTEDDMTNWLWIFSCGSSDTMVERFLSSNCRKPLFLAWMLLAKDKVLQKPQTLLNLVSYIHENYVLRDRPENEEHGHNIRPIGRDMTWWHFALILYRLMSHARDSWPTAIPALSRLVADYIRSIPDGKVGFMSGHQARCLLFNKAMQYFSWPAAIKPLAHMEYNWEAQQHLLAIAPEFEPALVLDQNSYRSIRTVLLGLPKSQSEARNSDRSAKTWPPYRQTVDGIDERRDPVDDLSRSAKAGLLMSEAGYPDTALDRAISALGGSTFGQPPTIQTRSLAPPRWSGKLASLNVYAQWAMRIRATKNAREAWMMFGKPPIPSIRPDIQVYAEMFDKLHAAQVSNSATVRPGDSKEVFKVSNGNLTQFAIARLTPPKPQELYDLMLSDGIRPTGYCLEVLIKMAPKKSQAFRVLCDSPWKEFARPLMQWKSWTNPEKMTMLSHLPMTLLNAWVYMLCRVQKGHTPRVRKFEPGGLPEAQPSTILEAIDLAYRYQAFNLKAAKHDRKPWHTILKSLAKDKVLYASHSSHSRSNIETTLIAFMLIHERAVKRQGNDAAFFMSLCVMIRKVLNWATFIHRDGVYTEREKLLAQPLVEVLIALAHKHAVRSFDELGSPMASMGKGSNSSGAELHPPSAMRYNIAGATVYRYMLAMGCCGNTTEMVKVMDWILDGWGSEYVPEDVKTPLHVGYAYVIRTFTYFVEMSKHLDIDSDEVRRLRERVEALIEHQECTWFWPEDPPTEERMAALQNDLIIMNRWPTILRMSSSDAFNVDARSVARTWKVKGLPSLFEDKNIFRDHTGPNNDKWQDIAAMRAELAEMMTETSEDPFSELEGQVAQEQIARGKEWNQEPSASW